MKTIKVVYAAMYLIIVALVGCGGGSSDPEDKGPQVGVGSGSLSGMVSDMGDGKRLANVKVLAGNQETTTDVNGEFVFSNLASDDYVVSFEKSNYAPGYSNVSVDSNGETVLLSLKQEGERQDYDATTEATIYEDTITGPYAVIFQSDSFDTADTNLTVSVTPLDPTLEADALPGQLETDTAMLVPLTFAEFSIFDAAGNKVNLKPGKEAIVELPIPVSLRNQPEYALGKTIHCYSYNPVTGQWEDFVVGTVVKSSVDGTTPVVRASIKHFSWYGAAPQSSQCIDIYGQVVSSVTGSRIAFARVEAFPGSATTSDANGNFRLATAAFGSPRITASRTLIDEDGSISGTAGARVIEYGSAVDIPLSGLVTRPCSDEPGSNPTGASSTEPGSQDNPIVITIGNLGQVSYSVIAYMTDENLLAFVNTKFDDQGSEVNNSVSGAKLTLTSTDGFVVDVTEVAAGYYIADIIPEVGKRYTLTIDTDNNGTVDGSGTVYMAGDVTFTSPLEGSAVDKEDLTISWSDSALEAESVDPNYTVTYWVYLTGFQVTETEFTIDTATYLGTERSFVVKSSINENQDLQPGAYSASIWASSGAYLPLLSGIETTIVNNITGPSVSGQFYVFSPSSDSRSFTVQ